MFNVRNVLRARCARREGETRTDSLRKPSEDSKTNIIRLDLHLTAT